MTVQEARMHGSWHRDCFVVSDLDGSPVAFDEQLHSRMAINREIKHSNDVMIVSDNRKKCYACYIAIDTVLHC